MENKYSNRTECGCHQKEAHSQDHGSGEGRSGGCSVQRSMDMWMCASHKAWREVHSDLLKTRILQKWGPQMEKTADAVVEAMGIEWDARQAQEKTKSSLKDRIAEIFAAHDGKGR